MLKEVYRMLRQHRVYIGTRASRTGIPTPFSEDTRARIFVRITKESAVGKISHRQNFNECRSIKPASRNERCRPWPMPGQLITDIDDNYKDASTLCIRMHVLRENFSVRDTQRGICVLVSN